MNTLEENYLERKPKDTWLASKATVFVCCLISSPLTAGVIYSSNLYRTGQSFKMIGTLLLISISELFVQMPLMGFEIGIPFIAIRTVSKGLLGLFIISWLWKRHFPKESIEKFEFKWLMVCVGVYYTYHYLWYILLKNDVVSSSSLLKSLNFYMSYYGKFKSIYIVLIACLMIRVVKKIIRR